MSYYPPPPGDNDDHHYQHHRQPLHHQASNLNRENIGWNNDNNYSNSRLPHDHHNNTIMSSNKYNHQYSQNNDTMPNNYNNNGRTTNSQQCDNYSHNRGRGGGGNHNPNSLKRAAKRRVKHDLPGPVGNWFRQKKQQQKSAAAAAVKNRKQSNARNNQTNENNNDRTQLLQSNTTTTMTIRDNNGESTTTTTATQEDGKPPIHSSPSSSLDVTTTTNKPQDEQLFHDHSSDLHECNAWNLMCTTLNRIVPPANHLLLHSNNHNPSNSTTKTTCAYSRYKTTLRTSIPNNYALLHEIHEGKYDTCHLTDNKNLHSNDLHVPLVIGYVASVQCHAHSDWTALLVDEMQSVVNNKYHHGSDSSTGIGGCSGSNNVGRGGVLCWIEERVVKQHANWIRPGVVWMIEGAKLALFTSLDEEEEEEDYEEEDERHHNRNHHNNNNSSSRSSNQTNGSGTTSETMTMVDTSPSTNNSRGGNSIDRMILVGESSLVYAWTPEEASCTFTHQEFSDLMERRCDLGLLRGGGGEELQDDNDGNNNNNKEKEKKEVVKSVDNDCMTLKPDSRKKKNGDNDDKDDEDAAVIVDKSNVPTAENIDVTVSTKRAPVAPEQVLEACSAANYDKPMHTESQKEHATRIFQEVNGEPNDAIQLQMKNLSNPYYAKKNLSQVTPHEEIVMTNSLDVGSVSRKDKVLDSSVQVQSKSSGRLSPVQAMVLNDMPETKALPQTPQLQITNRADHKIQEDDKIDNSFDDMLDEDSLNEAVLHHNVEGKPNNKMNETTSTGNDSFDDMLDEDSLDITPCKKKDEIGGKLDSKMNTPGVNSFDDMLDEDSLDVEHTPKNIGNELGYVKTNTPGGDSFDDMLDDDSDDDNIEAMFQMMNPQPESGNLFSPSQGVSVLDKDDLADLGDEDDDDF